LAGQRISASHISGISSALKVREEIEVFAPLQPLSKSSDLLAAVAQLIFDNFALCRGLEKRPS
jgi:hypothetical protein